MYNAAFMLRSKLGYGLTGLKAHFLISFSFSGFVLLNSPNPRVTNYASQSDRKLLVNHQALTLCDIREL